VIKARLAQAIKGIAIISPAHAINRRAAEG